MKRTLLYGLSLLAFAATSVTFTGCIDEAEMTNGATTEQVSTNENAISAFVMAVPANMLSVWDSGQGYSWGYGGLIHVRDMQTEDMVCNDGGSEYNWFMQWSQNTQSGRGYRNMQFLWNISYEVINAINSVIASVDSTTTNEALRGYLGVAHAYRAMMYLDLAREYEWLPNDVTEPESPEGNPIEGLTVPIVREGMTEDEQRSNPRATKEDMVAFILEDLAKAEEMIPDFTTADKTLPHLDCVYGLYARLYMWTEDYANAEKYARMAINESSSTPISEAEALNTSTGFNTITQFMWGGQYTESGLEHSLLNWTSWMSNECEYGYAAVAPIFIDKNMYDRLSDTDWRKLMWKAPAGSALDGQNTYCDDAIGAGLGDYASLKFRPGSGNTAEYSIGSATAYPLMRIEEMYFIEAEAAAHQDAARGKQLVENFMTTYRDPNYTCSVSSTDDVVEEIVFQKRIELWGEGQTFFDIKRLNYSVTRGYEGSNHITSEWFNTNGRPGWLNWQITQQEENGNAGVRGYNNPDASGLYKPWTGK